MPGDKVESPLCKATHVHPINGNWELGYLFIPYMCCIAKVSGKSRSLSIVCGLWWNSEVPEEAGLSYYQDSQSSSGIHCHQLNSHTIARHIMQAWLCTPVISALEVKAEGSESQDHCGGKRWFLKVACATRDPAKIAAR